MASISFPPQSRPGFPQHFDSALADPEPNRRLTMPPLPNPPFVFPARDPDTSVSSPADTERRTPPALPAFSFNPGADQSLQPTPPAHVPSRPGGHRRRPSEFVGDNQLVTPASGDADKREEPTTPTQPSAPTPGPPRGPGRRHHAHRRSQAVSGVDMLAIQKALATNPGAASAPNTPGDPLLDKGREDISRPLSYSAGSLGRPTPPASPQFPPSSIPPVPPIPASIQLESAPINDNVDTGRPVSAVFHKTPESPAIAQFQPPQVPTPPAETRSPHNRKSKPRPKTADASLAFDFMQAQNTPDVPSVKRSKSTGHPRSGKSKSVANVNATLENATHEGDDAHSTDTSRPSGTYSDDGSEASIDMDHEYDSSSPKKSSKSKKKQKRVRSWAGAILTRGKGKRHDKHEAEHLEVPAKDKCKEKARKLPPALTPPTLTRTNSEAGSVMEVDFDNDDVLVIRTPTNPEGPVSDADKGQDDRLVPPVPSLETSWKPRSFYEQTAQDDVLSSPIIDLDAALGPFNTPDMRPRGNLSKFSLATQRMYSGGRRGEFVGPEMRYHRRTESAPVMQPFDRSALTAIRLGGNGSETPDVFDEEEEDEFLAANQSPRNERAPPVESPVEIPVTQPEPQAPADVEKSTESIKSAGSVETLTGAPEPQPEGLGIQSTEEPANTEEAPIAIEHDNADSIEHVVNPFSKPFSAAPRYSSDHLRPEEIDPKQLDPHSPDISPRYLAVDKRPSTSPNQLLPSIPPFSLSAGVSPSESSFPSPDGPRFSDRNFSSHSYHHLPSDYPYASVEDVPSLTSSASTMTTAHRFSATFFPRGRLSSDRAASFSAAVNRRSSQANSSKRSSLASLSKLVGGQHSERSKLYQEEKPPGEGYDSSKKKSRRISRLMHFWKGKDKERTITEPSIPERPV